VDSADHLRQTEPVRDAFAHEAILSMDRDADVRALGAAITVALCRHWDHEPPCPLAPHHTSATRAGAQVHLRTLFAVEPAGEAEVRQRIGTALADGQLRGRDDKVTRWQVRSTRPSTVLPSEAEHAQRLVRS
jgi:hypothetical protein